MTIEAVEQVGAASGGGESGRDGLPGRPLPFEAAFRIMRISTDAGSFETPARMVSYDEQAARSAVPLSRALPAELAVDFRVVRGAGAASILAAARGGGSPEPDRRARLHCDITERALLRVTVHQPSPSALAGMSPAARVRFADAQAGLQPRDGSRGVVTYPYLGLRAGDYLRFVRSRRRAGDGTALFVLDAGMDGRTMEKVLDCIGEGGGPSLVPVIHGGAGGSPAGRGPLGRLFSRPNTAFLACQVPRVAPAGAGAGRGASGMHAACFQEGFDLAAPAQGRPRQPRGPRGAPYAAGFFSPETWRIDPLADALASRGPRLVDEFLFGGDNGPDRRLVASALGRHAAAATTAASAAGGRGYDGGDGDPAERRLLARLAIVHEAISSAAEFGCMRAAISGLEPPEGAAAPEIEIPLLAQG